jgi:DNA-binding NarL/FixJ family response regulator
MPAVPAPPLRVMIVDDHAGFRRVARRLLRARGYDVLGEAVSAESAAALVECLEPDAVLLDLRLGEQGGCDVVEALTRLRPGLAVLLVSVEEDYAEPRRVRESGARGFVAKARLADTDLTRFWSEAAHPVRTM